MIHATETGLAIFTARAGSRAFRAPVEIVRAHTLDEVLPCMERIDRAVQGGLHAAGFLSYEAAPAFDFALTAHPPQELPLLWFGLYEKVREEGLGQGGRYESGSWQPLIDEHHYKHAIVRLREYIAAGDTYQVNFTFPLEASFCGDPLAWYCRLVEAQKADHCAYIDTGRWRILSASPELFFRLDGTALETRPMKGTRRRGRWGEEDLRFAEALATDDKDRAENVMIVDLLRNDMGRVSDIGSVAVERLFEVERYETVWQMTSTVRSRTNASVPEILSALFPSGSVTGAPKPRTMAIIREMEPYPRGVYCGAMGWWSPGRQAEFNVAIRTVTVDSVQERARYHVGGGITWDSTPQGEYEECRTKAAVLTFHRPEFELIESIRFEGAYVLLEEHLVRLRDSAEYFGYSINLEAIRSALHAKYCELVGSTEHPQKVRLLLARDGSIRIENEPAKPASVLRVGFAREPVDETDVMLFHKTTIRDVYRQALDLRPDCDDVLLWNRRGEVTESTVANVVVRLEGELVTPPVACGLLPGTMRAKLLVDGTLREAVLMKEDVLRAEEVHLINSVRGWIPVVLQEPCPIKPESL